MALYVWVEPHFSLTPWYADLKNGLKSALAAKRIKAKTEILETPASIDDHDGMVVLVGETYGWYNNMLQYLDKNDIQVCVVACEISDTRGASCITTDHRKDMANLIHFMCEAGRSRIAFFGFNPSSPHDRQRIDGFHYIHRPDGFTSCQDDIYYMTGDVLECSERLMQNIRNYNAIIAGNDLYALFLMSRLKASGLRIPEDIFVASFGNTLLSGISNPTLSSMSVNLYQVGEMVINAYTTWLKNPSVSKYVYLLESTFYSRETTANLELQRRQRKHYAIEEEIPDISSYADTSLLKLVRLENFISKADVTDLSIVLALLDNSPIDALSEKLYISDSALDYRLSKMYKHFEVNSRHDFVALLQEYASQIHFPEKPLTPC